MIGFIGLGVMGEPMCRNLRVKSGQALIGFDIDPRPLERLAGVERAASAREVVARSDIVFVSLPSGRELEALVEDVGRALRPNQVFVDLGTSPVELTRRLAQELGVRGVRYLDAPVARTRAAAEAGTLSVMVGGTAADFETVRPLIACFASEITHCGAVGAGQVAKIMNNLVLMHTVAALADAHAIAAHVGVDPKLLFETLAKGSADSFALRNHGLKAIVPADFPLRAFSTEYARKDLAYALELYRDAGVDAARAEAVDRLLGAAIDAGWGEAYWPVISKVVSRA